MLWKRQEPFRFKFEPPLEATFRIVKLPKELSQKSVKSSSGKSEILDLSPAGLKIRTPFAIPVAENLLLEFEFVLNSHQFKVMGQSKWRRKVQQQFYYGINLVTTEDLRQEIVDELKSYVKH